MHSKGLIYSFLLFLPIKPMEDTHSNYFPLEKLPLDIQNEIFKHLSPEELDHNTLSVLNSLYKNGNCFENSKIKLEIVDGCLYYTPKETNQKIPYLFSNTIESFKISPNLQKVGVLMAKGNCESTTSYCYRNLISNIILIDLNNTLKDYKTYELPEELTSRSVIINTFDFRHHKIKDNLIAQGFYFDSYGHGGAARGVAIFKRDIIYAISKNKIALANPSGIFVMNLYDSNDNNSLKTIKNFTMQTELAQDLQNYTKTNIQLVNLLAFNLHETKLLINYTQKGKDLIGKDHEVVSLIENYTPQSLEDFFKKRGICKNLNHATS